MPPLASSDGRAIRQEHSLTRAWDGEGPLYLTAGFAAKDKILLSQTPYDPHNCENLIEEVVGGF